MEKTLGNMAAYLKELLPVWIPEDFEVDEPFLEIRDGDEIRQGVNGVRNLMISICDSLIENKDFRDVPIKGKKKFSDETTLTIEFPFLNNIKSVLINIGQLGILSENGDSIMMVGWDSLSLKRSLNKNSRTKISLPQMRKTLKFLSGCGFSFEGIDLEEKKPELSNEDTIVVTYPKEPKMLVGLRVLGLAQDQLATRKNDDILLRCDYRSLSKTKDISPSILKDFLNPMPEGLRETLSHLHQHYLDSGMTCQLDLGFCCTHFIYSYKRKPLWRLSKSFHNGYRIILKTKQMDKYTDVINEFPKELRQKINKGYGCDRKKGSGHGNCQKGCEGFSFPIDDRLLDMSNDLILWQDSELAFW